MKIDSVQFGHSVVSDSLRPHESQHARPPCPSPTPGVHSDSCPSSPWCHPAISSSVVPFSSCPQSLPASESFPMSQHFSWCGQSTGVSALASFLPKKSQGWSLRMDWLDLLAVQGTLKSLLQHHSSNASILQCSAFFTVQLSHPYMETLLMSLFNTWQCSLLLRLGYNILKISIKSNCSVVSLKFSVALLIDFSVHKICQLIWVKC